MKKRRDKVDQCLRYLKQWVLSCLPKKRKKMNKDSPCSLVEIFSSFKKVFKEQSRIRIATIYIHTHVHPDLIV
jgi:hypothetical protein